MKIKKELTVQVIPTRHDSDEHDEIPVRAMTVRDVEQALAFIRADMPSDANPVITVRTTHVWAVWEWENQD